MFFKATVLLVSTALNVWEIVAKDDGCPLEIRNCSCAQTNRIDCQLKGYWWFPEDLETNGQVTDIELKYNNLTAITKDHFGSFPQLRHLNLYGNQISTISKKAFDKNPELRTIYLTQNRLKSLPTDIFNNLIFLQNVYLEYNNLKRIESEHFNSLINLMRVRLHNNELTYVAKDAFVNSLRLDELYLDFNQLSTPEKNWLIHFDHTDVKKFELYLDNNPWSCDCRMQDFYKWAILRKWLSHANEEERITVPKCVEPKELRGKTFSTISSGDDLICTGVNITYVNGRVNTVEGHSIEISCEATGIPTPTVELRDSNGRVLVSRKGHVSYRFNDISVSDSGEYHCNASGYKRQDQDTFRSIPIKVSVYKNPASVVSSVLIGLLVFGILFALAVWYYKKKHKHATYGKLPTDSNVVDGDQIASYARRNAESMRVTLSPSGGNSSYQSAIASHMATGDYGEDDEITEFNKDTEYLV